MQSIIVHIQKIVTASKKSWTMAGSIENQGIGVKWCICSGMKNTSFLLKDKAPFFVQARSVYIYFTMLQEIGSNRRTIPSIKGSSG